MISATSVCQDAVSAKERAVSIFVVSLWTKREQAVVSAAPAHWKHASTDEIVNSTNLGNGVEGGFRLSEGLAARALTQIRESLSTRSTCTLNRAAISLSSSSSSLRLMGATSVWRTASPVQ
jgi:hypothetical protein